MADVVTKRLSRRKSLVVRTVARAVGNPVSPGRKLGSAGVITERMAAWSAEVLSGSSPASAARAAGYAGSGGSAARNNSAHEGLISRNCALLDKAGVTEELLALKLREGLDAERTIAVSVIKEDGVITGKELIKEADMAVRHRYLSSVATLRGMTPQMEKIRIDIESRNVNVQDMNVSLSAGLEGLQGAALLAEFTKRMALYSSGQALPVVPEVMERVAAVGDVPVVYAAVVAVEPDTGRKITDLPCFLAERAAMAQAATPTTPDGRIVFDPTTGEIIETIELRAERVSDVRRAAVAVGKRAEKCAGTMASGMLRGLPKIRGRKWVTGASGELISVAREDLSQ